MQTPSKARWAVLAATIVVILGIVALVVFRLEHGNPFDKGAVFPAVSKTLAEGGPVKDDLIHRGLFVPPTGSAPGELKLGEIEKLLADGVYAIGADGALVFGPRYRPPEPR